MGIRVTLLAGDGHSSRTVARHLDQWFDLKQVLVENKASRRKRITRRAKRLGWHQVANQLVFQTAITKLLHWESRQRLAELRSRPALQAPPFPEERTLRVSSVNDDKVIALLRKSEPDVVVVNGTRILAKRILAAINTPFVNTHMGITPAYRGVHGGYWALAEQKARLAGATVHLVDSGIDTGQILGQIRFQPTANDSFVTYPLLQLEAVLPVLKEGIEKATSGLPISLASPAPCSRSQLYYHPTATGYLFRRWLTGVR